MTIRNWVAQTMATDIPLAALVSTRVYQSTSLRAAPHEKPFLMYRMTSDVEVMRGDDDDATRNAGFMIFAHDEPGDYMGIDAVMIHLRRLFKDTRDPAENVIRSRWIETSEDFRDEDMGTIMKFARIQVNYRV